MARDELEKKLSISKRELASLIKELKNWSAPATTLLSLYIPPGRPISEVMNLLRQEYSIADNIKLKRTKLAVRRALAAAMDRLQQIPKVPPNGLVIFCGEDMKTGKFECFVFSPPEPINVFYYRTDKRFITEFLEEIVEEKDAIGIIIIERDQATIGLLRGTRLEVLDEIEGYVPGKHKMGGQSQRRYERIIEQMVEEFYKKVGEEANKRLVPLAEKGVLKGVIVAGPGYAKKDFVEGGYLDYRLRRLLAPELIDVAYQGLQGLKEVVLKAEKVVETQLYRDVVNSLEEFKMHLARNTGMVVYGEREVKEALEMGAVKTLLVHENRPDVEKWEEEASKSAAKVVVVPESLPEAEWFYKTFQGLAGILRYKLGR